MTPVNQSGKRRRVQNASSVLSKPFKSPLRRPAQGAEYKNEAPRIKEGVKAEQDSSRDLHIAVDEKGNTDTPTSTASTPSTINAASQTRKRKLAATPTKAQLQPDPVIADLQSQQKALQVRVATLRSELDTAQQARRIESSNRDVELERLIAKWRSVSQSAAEEVFEGAQERFSRMGGMKAWKERTKSQNERWQQEEMESWYGNAGAEGTDVDADKGELARKRELLDELESRAKKESDEAKENEKDDENEVGFFSVECPGIINTDSGLTGIYHGNDAQDIEYRLEFNRIRCL